MNTSVKEFWSQFSRFSFLKFLTFNTGCALETVRITELPSEIGLAENQLPGNLHRNSLFPEEKREELREIRDAKSLLPLGQSLRAQGHIPTPRHRTHSCCHLLRVVSQEYCVLLKAARGSGHQNPVGCSGSTAAVPPPLETPKSSRWNYYFALLS